MAFNSSALLPHLYDVHRNIQYMEKHFGSRVKADAIVNPATARSSTEPAAPKSRIQNFLLRCADSLFQYSRIRKTLEDTKDSRKMTALIYFVFACVLLTVVLFVFMLMVVFMIVDFGKVNPALVEGAKGFWEKFVASAGGWFKAENNWRVLYYLMVAIVTYGFVLVMSFQLYNRNRNMYEIMYQPDVLETGGDSSIIIKDVVNMFNVKQFDNNNLPSDVVTNSPLLHFYYMKIRKDSALMTEDDKAAMPCRMTAIEFMSDETQPAGGSGCISLGSGSVEQGSADGANEEEGKDPLEACCDLQTDKEVVDKCFLCTSVYNNEKYIAPFHPQMTENMWTYKLMRKLQRHDIPAQTSRIRAAMDYLKQMVLKDFDESQKGGLTPEEESALIENIAKSIAFDGAEVLDLAIVGDLSTVATAMDATLTTAAACYATAINDPTIAAAYFDKTTGKGYKLTKQQLESTWLRYDSGGYNNGGLFLKVPTANIVTGTRLDAGMVESSAPGSGALVNTSGVAVNVTPSGTLVGNSSLARKMEYFKNMEAACKLAGMQTPTSNTNTTATSSTGGSGSGVGASLQPDGSVRLNQTTSAAATPTATATATSSSATGSGSLSKEVIKVNVVIVANKRNSNYFDTYFRTQCKTSDRAGCSWAYTGMGPGLGVVPGSAMSGIDNWTPDYVELFKDANSSAPNTIGQGVSNNMYAASIDLAELIKMKREARMPALMDMLRGFLPSHVIKNITTMDPENSWTLGDKQLDDIASKIRKARPDMNKLWHIYQPIVRDILLSAANGLIAERNAAQEAAKRGSKASVDTRFVSFERFQARLAAMSQKDFMEDFMYNLDEMRLTSEGLALLYKRFDYSTNVHNANQLIMGTILVFTIVVGLMVMAEFTYGYWKDMKAQLDDPEFLNKLSYEYDANEKDLIMNSAKWNVYFTFGIKVAICSAALLTAIVMIHAFKQKSNDLFEYNKNILQKNTSSIVDGSREMFDFFYTEVMGDPITAASNADDHDLQYVKIMTTKGSAVDPQTVAGKMSIYEYDRLLTVIKSFDKCSTIFSTSDTLLPFPMFEVSIYLFMIVCMLILLIAVTMTMHPLTKMEEMRRYVRVRARLLARKETSQEELPSTCINEIEKRKINNMIKLTAIILLIVLPVLFAATLMNNLAMFSSSIYLSDYFAKSDCYEP